jgi:outer membrane cobalamin receptor
MKLINNGVLLLILSLLTGIAAAQDTGTIIGMVLDASTNEPLPGATVSTGDNTGAATNVSGRYSMDLPPGEYELKYHYLGYIPQYKKVVIDTMQALIINIKLMPLSTDLGTVVISAGKFEQNIEDVVVSMEVLKPQLIENKNTTTLETAVDQIPGVTVIDGQINVRGGSGYSYGAGSRVLVLMDGIPILAPDANDVKWNFLPVENIEQVEVIKGAASSLYGSAAMNGIMNLRIATPGEKPETKINFFYGWYGKPKRDALKWWDDKVQELNGLSFSHRERIKRLDLVLGGQVYQNEGYRMGENEKRYRFTANGKLTFPKTPGLSAGINTNIVFSSGGLFFLWEDDSTGAYIPQGGLTDSTTTLSLYETTRTSISPYVSYITAKGSNHHLKTRYFRSANRNNTNQESVSTMYYTEYQYQNKITDEITFTTGLVNIYTDVNSELYEDHVANNTAVYIQGDAHTDRWNFSMGARVESNAIDGKDHEVIPVFRSGISYRLASFTHIRASFGQGYRYPSIAEKFINTGVGSIAIYPNPAIKSETGWTTELGVKQGFKIASWRGLLDVAGFRSEYRDMMEFTFGLYGPFEPPSFGFGFQSQNIGNTVIKGIDISVSGSGNIGAIPITILTGYTYIDPKQKDFDIATDTLKNTANYNVLKYRYKHLFKGDIEINPGKFMIGLSSRYNSFMENIDAVFEELIPGVKNYRNKHDYGDWVFDLRLGYRISTNAQVSFIVDNLFNHEYMGRPADMRPPRTYTFRVSFSY